MWLALLVFDHLPSARELGVAQAEDGSDRPKNPHSVACWPCEHVPTPGLCLFLGSSSYWLPTQGLKSKAFKPMNSWSNT
ncbi:unnamed protein product [Caenorhabditis auriculariae]|uniref:Uncharacterized protein n=1 Tax=Caenorhabditis auriculariae TaxID=2777116 RepID=A0A8S1HSK6_9PELO|nr:unnamed protein product [Caenorhabditis auriculariae]